MGTEQMIADAAALAGLNEPPANAELWAATVVNDVLIYTRRAELPPQLVPVAVQILAEVFKQGGALGGSVQSIKEGDTAITFAGLPEVNAVWERFKPQLQAFRKIAP